MRSRAPRFLDARPFYVSELLISIYNREEEGEDLLQDILDNMFIGPLHHSFAMSLLRAKYNSFLQDPFSFTLRLFLNRQDKVILTPTASIKMTHAEYDNMLKMTNFAAFLGVIEHYKRTWVKEIFTKADALSTVKLSYFEKVRQECYPIQPLTSSD